MSKSVKICQNLSKSGSGFWGGFWGLHQRLWLLTRRLWLPIPFFTNSIVLLIIGCIVRSGWFAILVSDGTCDLECAGEGGGSGIRIQTMTVRYYVAFCTRLAQAKSAVGVIVREHQSQLVSLRSCLRPRHVYKKITRTELEDFKQNHP